MHRSITIVLPSEAAASLLAKLEANEHVLSIAHNPGAGVRPKGDVVAVHVLNRGADDVMAVAAEAGAGGEFSISTEESASFNHPDRHDEVVNDYDEGQWEEMETSLRHQARIGVNFVALCAAGGAIAAVGMLEQGTGQVMLLVAASIIAPVFEPVAGIALGIALRDGAILKRALASTLVGYLVLVVGAGVALLALKATGAAQLNEFLGNPQLGRLAHPDGRDVLAGGAAALAGSVMVAAFRRSVMAGPLVALAIVPSAAAGGMALAIGRLDRAGETLVRLGLDLALIVVIGAAVFGLKRLTVHRRDPLA